jgi:hypothetical protein
MSTKIASLVVGILVASLLLAACAGAAGQTGSTTGTTTSSGDQTATSLSKVNKLLVGTLKMVDTDQALTADEASQLLPLWQAYRSLSSSQTAAEEEVDALLNQIQSTMTTDQVNAIEAMNLTSIDMMDLMQSMGGAMVVRGTPDPQSTPGFDISIQGFPPGGFQGGDAAGPSTDSSGGTTRNFRSGEGGAGPVIIQGGPSMGGDAGSAAGIGGPTTIQGTADPSMQATAQARFSTQASQVNSLLLNILISQLESMTNG